MLKLCHLCRRQVSDQKTTLGKRIAFSVKPKGEATRYYCEECYYKLLKENGRLKITV